MTLQRNFIVFLGSIIALGTFPAYSEVVVCTASKGFHCSSETDCKPDATYITTYRIDREKKTVESVSTQHTKKDLTPQPDGTNYQILLTGQSLLNGEKSITAIGRPGLDAVETLIIGEKSYLSSSASSTQPRAFVMFGTCAGFSG